MKVLLIICITCYLLISTVFACQMFNAGAANSFCAGQCPNGYVCSLIGHLCYCGFKPGTIIG